MPGEMFALQGLGGAPLVELPLALRGPPALLYTELDGRDWARFLDDLGERRMEFLETAGFVSRA